MKIFFNFLILNLIFFFANFCPASHIRPFADIESNPYLLIDFNPSKEIHSFHPTSEIVFLGSNGFFLGGEGDIYLKNLSLWKTDGTYEGTKRIYSFPVPEKMEEGAFGLISTKQKLFFFATNGDSDLYYLWTSDGTTEGTKPLVSIGKYYLGFYFEIVASQDKVFFIRYPKEDSSQTELWISDGTPQGTKCFYVFSSRIGELSIFKDKLYFCGWSKDNGYEVWVSNGTKEGTYLFKDLINGSKSSNPKSFTPMGSKLFFTAQTGNNSYEELWVSDGTENGTKRISNPQVLSCVNKLTPSKEFLYFSGCSAEGNYGICRSDGTEEGTIFLKELVYLPGWERIDMADLPSGISLFSATSSHYETEIWRTDGTPEGTYLLLDIVPGSFSSSAQSLTFFNGYVYFSALYKNQMYLWRTDGTIDGTKRIYKNSTGPISPYYLKSGEDKLLFFAKAEGFGSELWSSDGTEEGTNMVYNLFPDNGSSTFEQIISLGDSKILFKLVDWNERKIKLLSYSDNSKEFQEILSSNIDDCGIPFGSLVPANGKAIFPYCNLEKGLELWSTDGTIGGTKIIKDIIPGPTDSLDGKPGVFYNGYYYFSGSDGIHGLEPWRTDGTAESTYMISDICTGWNSSWPDKFTHTNNHIFWTGYGINRTIQWYSLSVEEGIPNLLKDFELGPNSAKLGPSGSTDYFAFIFLEIYQDHSWELWVSNGEAENTNWISSFMIDYHNYWKPQNIFSFCNRLYFSASPYDGNELWVSDGTPGGTYLFKDIFPKDGSSSPAEFVVLGNKFYFRANDGVHGFELWESDGTEAGTKLFLDICPGPCSSYPNNLVSDGNKIFFSGTDGIYGLELWESDGTEEGTKMVRDIMTGAGSSSPEQITISGTKIYFTADDGINGRELWCYEIKSN